MEKDLIIVLDFGGQYNQLIARRVRECSVYCEVHPYTISLEELKAKNPKGIIQTGTSSVRQILLGHIPCDDCFGTKSDTC